MAISYDTASSTSSTTYGAETKTYSHTCTSASVLVVTAHVWCDTASGAVSGITYAGNAMTIVGTAKLNGDMYSVMYRLFNPASGANNIVVSFTGNGIHKVIEAVSLIGTVTDAVEANAGDDTDGGTTADVSITTVAANAWIVAGMTHYTTATVTPVANFTERAEIATANILGAIGTREVVSPGATTVGWTWTGAADSSIVAGSFAPAVTANTIRNLALLGVG